MESALDLLKPTGSYSVKEATLYIGATIRRQPALPRITTQHLHWWVRKGLTDGSRDEDSSKDFINFLELISFRMIAMLRTYGITSPNIGKAHRSLQEKWGWDYPFAMESIWVTRPDIFVELGGTPVSVTRDFQSALSLIREFWEPVEAGFYGLTFDENSQASTWMPSSGVVINPKVQFGEPCIQDTKVPTETIWAFYRGGDSIDTLAYMYDLPPFKVQDAIEWEEKVARAATDNSVANVPA